MIQANAITKSRKFPNSRDAHIELSTCCFSRLAFGPHFALTEAESPLTIYGFHVRHQLRQRHRNIEELQDLLRV
jgi:hypothetical protein